MEFSKLKLNNTEYKLKDQTAREGIENLDEKITSNQNKTNSDIKSLANEIGVERARINSLTRLEEGSTTGDAELIDIRIGENGVIYENAGEAVRGQVGFVKNSLFNIINFTDFELEVGSFNQNADPLDANNRLRTKDFFYAPKGTIISLSDFGNYQLNIPQYNLETKTLLKSSEWIRNSYTIEQDCYCKFMICGVNNIDFSTYDNLDEFYNLIYVALNNKALTSATSELMGIRVGENGEIYENAGESVRKQIGFVKDNLCNIINFTDFEFELGSFNQNADPIDHNLRLRTKDFFYAPKGTILSLRDFGNYQLNIPQYNLETKKLLKSSEWVRNSYTIEQDCYCKFMISGVNNSVDFSTYDSFDEFYNLIYVTLNNKALSRATVNPVWFGSTTYPNIDTVNGTITFPSDGTFMRDHIACTPVNLNEPISLQANASGGTKMLVLDIESKLLKIVTFREQLLSNDVIIGGIKVVYSPDKTYKGFVNAQLPFDFTVDGKFPTIKEKESVYHYSGKSIAPQQKIRYETKYFPSTPDINNYQGMACYGNYIVRCADQLASISIYRKDTFENLGHILDITTEKVAHCNTISFGNKYSEDDTLPLLYCSAEAVDSRCIYVFRINNAFDSATLIQTINFPSFDEMPIYWPNGAVDIARGQIVVNGYHTNAHGANGSIIYPDDTQGYYRFNLPTTENSVVNLTSSDIIDTFTLPAITTTQGFQVNNGIIHQAYGAPWVTEDPYPKIVAVDVDKKEYINVVHLVDFGITGEPEGLCIDDGKILIDNFGTVRIFNFD